MKNIKFTPFFLLISILFSLLVTPAQAVEDPAVNASAIVLVETNTEQVFFSRNADARVYPASTTKIMTTLLALEAVESGKVTLYDPVTTTSSMTYDLISDGSSAGIYVGETLTLESLLYCTMVASANEACNAIAEYISGSIPAFIELMNTRAREIGCTGTHFANTHGLPNENHYSTAWDFYLITREAMTHPLFAEISNTAIYEVPATNMSGPRTLSNTNGLINEQSYYTGYFYEYASGIKTGYTSAAGYCLISTAAKGELDLMAVVMGGIVTQKEDGTLDYGSFSDSIALYEWAFSNFSYQTILSSTDAVTSVEVDMGDADSVSLRPAGSVTALLPNDTDISSFKTEITIYDESHHAPISAGEVLGELKVVRDGAVYGSTKLIAASSVELSKINYIKNRISETVNSPTVKKIFRWLIVLICVYLLIVIVYRVQRIRHVRSVRKARQQRAQAVAEAEARRQFNASRPPEEPSIEFISRESVQRSAAANTQSRPRVSAQTRAKLPAQAPVRDSSTQPAATKPVPGSNSADRDYFEEFFKK